MNDLLIVNLVPKKSAESNMDHDNKQDPKKI